MSDLGLCSSDDDEHRPLSSSKPWPEYRSVGSREQVNASAGYTNSNIEDYIPLRRRKLALALIQLCHLCTWTAAYASIYWLPRFIRVGEDYDYHIVDLTLILFYCTGWISGVITDSCVSKVPALLFSAIYSTAGVVGCLLIIHYRKVTGDGDKTTLQPGYDTLYTVLLLSTSVVMPVISILLPTLGADQIPVEDRDGVRKFYTWFYFIRKLAELFNHVFFLTLIHYNLDADDIDLPWVVFMFMFTVLGIVLVIIVSLPRLTRKVNADISVLKDGCGILVQAIKRRRLRAEGDNILSGAARRNGGDYHNNAVNERVKMIKFAVTLLLLIPVAFSAAPAPFVDYNPDESECPAADPTDNNITVKYGVQETMYVTKCCSTAVGIVLLYCICHAASFSRFRRPTLFARLIAGHMTMILATIWSMIGNLMVICSLFYKGVPYALNGLTDALIYTTGFELAFIMAPRSMQGTSFGMFYLVPGIAYSLTMITDHYLISHLTLARDWIWIIGIAGNFVGIILLSVVHKCFDLGLSVH